MMLLRLCRKRLAASAGVIASWALLTAPSARADEPLRLDVRAWRIVARESGRVDYYTVVLDPATPYIHAAYRPPYETAVLGVEIPEAERQAARKLSWTWRAVTLPQGGDECAHGKEDSAAVIYVTWRRGLRFYSLKYVWSAVGKEGAVCDRRRSPFVAQDTIIQETGGPLNVWQKEEIDLKAEFRKHFADGDANADVPDLRGIGLMTDGDQTHSESAADYASFSITR